MIFGVIGYLLFLVKIISEFSRLISILFFMSTILTNCIVPFFASCLSISFLTVEFFGVYFVGISNGRIPKSHFILLLIILPFMVGKSKTHNLNSSKVFLQDWALIFIIVSTLLINSQLLKLISHCWYKYSDEWYKRPKLFAFEWHSQILFHFLLSESD